MTENNIAVLTSMAAKAKVLRLFLDYDGTLAGFADHPDMILPDRELVLIMAGLVSGNGILPAVISGRRLADIQQLIPVHGLLLGGTYGIEMQLPDGRFRSAMSFDEARPIIEHLLPHWMKLIENRDGFHLEDKGWSLALHGRFAQREQVEMVMTAANKEVQELQLDPSFQLYIGDRFLEYAPKIANKAISVRWIINKMTPPDAFVVYIGDDDKDEEAFRVVLETGGFAIRVAASSIKTCAQFWLPGPSQVRAWLNDLIKVRKISSISNDIDR